MVLLITAGGSYCECRLSSLFAYPFFHLYGAAKAKTKARSCNPRWRMRNERGLSDGGERERHVSGIRDVQCWPGHEPPRSGSVSLSALNQPVVNWNIPPPRCVYSMKNMALEKSYRCSWPGCNVTLADMADKKNKSRHLDIVHGAQRSL